jgi:hypothetical protein
LLLIWLDKHMTWLAWHDGSPGRSAVFSECGDPVLPDHQGLVQDATAAHRAMGTPLARVTMARGFKFPGDGAWPIDGKAIPRIAF